VNQFAKADSRREEFRKEEFRKQEAMHDWRKRKAEDPGS
jgi:hypothetical protein